MLYSLNFKKIFVLNINKPQVPYGKISVCPQKRFKPMCSDDQPKLSDKHFSETSEGMVTAVGTDLLYDPLLHHV